MTIRSSRKRLLAAALLAAGLALPHAAAASGGGPTLRPEVELIEEIVTLGHLFENAGPLSKKPVYRSPDLGTTGRVPVSAVMAMARRAGLDPEPAGFTEVIVTRVGLEVGEELAERLIAAEVVRQLGLNEPADFKVTFSRPLARMTAALGSHQPLRLTALRYTRSNGAFEALLTLDQGNREIPVRARGTALEMVEIPVLRRPLGRDQIVGRGDVVMRQVPRQSLRGVAIEDPARLIGKAAKRRVRAETPLSPDNFGEPELVHRGSRVSVVYRNRGLVLQASGLALQDGAMGELVNIRNPRSKRVIQAVVTGPDQVAVSPAGQDTIAMAGRGTK